MSTLSEKRAAIVAGLPKHLRDMANTPKGWRLKHAPSAEEMADKPTPDLLDNLDVHLEHIANAVEKVGHGSPEKVASDKQQIANTARLLGRLWRDRRSAR